MSTPRFDLVDIVQTIKKRFRFILIVTLVAAVIGVAFHYLGKKEFTAKVQFFISNPLLTDRTTMYGGGDSRIDYFGNDNDVDRVLALAESDTVIMKVLQETNLAQEMNKDLSNVRNVFYMKDYFLKHMKITRTEYTMVEVSFSDKDPVRAAKIANAFVDILEQVYLAFYTSPRGSIYASLSRKYTEQDSLITAYTDTLGEIRNRTGIYDLVSPNRNNIINGTINARGSASGRDIELIQNIEALKDGLVMDQVRIATLLNQFTTGSVEQGLRLFKVISPARQPVVPKGLPGLMTLIASCMIGFFFAVLFVLISTYYKALIAVER